MNRTRSLVAVVLSALLVFCTGQAPATAETNPYGGTFVSPPGANEIIFSLVNGSKTINYSMKSLRALNTKNITIYEPFVKKTQSFTVIPLSVFSKQSRISPKARIQTIALNDYIYANTLRRFLKADAFLAIAREGKPIPYDQGGPIRLVFADDSRWSKNLDAWNWSLRSITVK